MESSSLVCILQDGCSGESQIGHLYTAIGTAAKERLQQMLTLSGKERKDDVSWRQVTIQQLFLLVYREHKLGGHKTEMFLSHDEHLVAVQLSIAAWNKKEKGAFEADAQSVLRISKAILKQKMERYLSCVGRTAEYQLVGGTAEYQLVGGTAEYQLVGGTAEPVSPIKTTGMIVTASSTRSVRSTPTISPFRAPGSEKWSNCSDRTPRSSPRTRNRMFPTTPQTNLPGSLRLIDSPRTPLVKVDDEMVLDVLSLYDDFIQKCGKVDIIDIFTRVKEFFQQNSNELLIFKKDHLLVIDKLPRDEIERAMLRCLAGDDLVCCISSNKIHIEGLCWEDGHLGGCDISNTTVPLSFLWKSPDLAGCVYQKPEPAMRTISVSEQFIRKLFLSYLSLLVNSADELALARCLCLPDRGLGHHGFTALKHLATKKKMSMFLTSFSFVFEMRRVKTTSDSYAPLFEHAKALSDFVDTADNLLTITQDVADVDLAARKVLKTLKCNLGKSRTCTLRQESMKKVCEELLDETKQLLETPKVDLKITPKPVGAGGSMRGQKVIKLFRTLLDIEATNFSQNQSYGELVDQEATQGTPMRFPSLLSQFRSPSVLEQQSLTSTSISQDDVKAKAPVSYTKSHYGWVAPSLMLVDESLPLGFHKRTSAASEEDSPALPIRVLKEICDKKISNGQDECKKTEGEIRDNAQNVTEDVHDEDKEEQEVAGRRTTSTPSAGKVAKNKKPSLKRKKLKLDATVGAKKARTDARKKTLPLPKGQRLLTKFFSKSS